MVTERPPSKIVSLLAECLKGKTTSELEQIAVKAGVYRNVPRKILYGERPNPTVSTVEPLLDYFGFVIKRR